jgi:hypothetical protein
VSGAVDKAWPRHFINGINGSGEANMEPKGPDMGDYQERYRDCEIEVAVEQVLTGVKAHFRILRDGVVVIDWRLVHIDSLWPTEHTAAKAALRAARATIDAALPAGRDG